VNIHFIRNQLILLLSVALPSVCGLSGCATNAQTAAATAGGLLVTGLGVAALTNSQVDITVDMYAPTDGQRTAMRLNRRTRLMQSIHDRLGADADPVLNPTPEKLTTVSIRLHPVMDVLQGNIITRERAISQLRRLPGDAYKNVAATFERQKQVNIGVVDAWNAFNNTLNANLQRLNDAVVLASLARQLFVLRERADPKRRFDVVTQDYIDFFKSQMRAAILADLKAANVPNFAEISGKLMNAIKDDPAAPGIERIGAILEAVSRTLVSVRANHDNLNRILAVFGIPLNSEELLALDSREAILRSLTTPPLAPCVDASTTPTAREVSDLGAVQLATYIDSCKAFAYNYTFDFSRAIADVNLGPISNEVTQVLHAANQGLSVISDPANADRWRISTAHANSRAGPGNHNSIIYFENMGLPVVKSSAFDPTKFVVAAGALYRQVFSASVAAFGAPLPATAGPAGAPDFQSSNLIATRARVRNAEKAATAARQKILDALKVAIDEQKKVTADAWKKDNAAVIKSAQEALQNAASQLEATAGSK
jgi:hypothetical protein